jgi:hypothetical protein
MSSSIFAVRKYFSQLLFDAFQAKKEDDYDSTLNLST